MLATYGYDAGGLLAQVARANGTTTTYAYDRAARLTELRTTAGLTELSWFEYTLDRLGLRLAVTESLPAQIRTIAYGYDGLLRLIGATESPGTTYAYAYDLAGNRTAVWSNGVQVETRSYDAANQVLGWQYDAAGNLTNAGSATYSYDALNRLKQHGSTSYSYNGDGVLVAQTANSVTTRYTQDLAAPLSQILQISQGSASSHYLYGLERLAALSGSTRSWYAADALGSVRRTLTDSGVPGSVIHYDPWGLPLSGSVPTFGFTGELQDSATGLVYLRARWYHAGHGTFPTFRWRTNESFNEIPYSHHPYQYAYSNPILNTDPTGKYSRSPFERMIQQHYEARYTVGIFQAEYPIYLGSKQHLDVNPQTGRLEGNAPDSLELGWIDIVDIYGELGYAYEIKKEINQERGSLEIERYIQLYNTLPPPKTPRRVPRSPRALTEGSNFPADRWERIGINPVYPGATVYARLAEPGVIVWRSFNNNRPIPVVVDAKVKVNYKERRSRPAFQPVPAFAYGSCVIFLPGLFPPPDPFENDGDEYDDDEFPPLSVPPEPMPPRPPDPTPRNDLIA